MGGDKSNTNSQPLTPQPLGNNSGLTQSNSLNSGSSNNNGATGNNGNNTTNTPAEAPLKRKPSVSSLIKKGMLRGSGSVDSHGGTNLREVGLPKIGSSTQLPTSPSTSGNGQQNGGLTSSSSNNGTKPPFNLRNSQTSTPQNDNTNGVNNNNNNNNTSTTPPPNAMPSATKKTPLKNKVVSFVHTYYNSFTFYFPDRHHLYHHSV
jgi:hypothetical protein